MLAIIDYQCGNLGSISNMLKKLGVVDSVVTADPHVIGEADRLILPGVGSFDTGMRNIRDLGLEAVLSRKAMDEKIPVLGVCLGMQLLFESSEEGTEPGLGWFEGRVSRFRVPEGSKLKVPHMGWNTVRQVEGKAIFDNQAEEFAFYFVHSFYVACDSEKDVAGWTRHGDDFASAVAKDNIWAVQFHPEKSHKYGMNLFRNFLECS